MAGRLDGSWAVVTGAGRGIGRAVALSLAREGARLALVSRTRHELEDTAHAAGAAEARVFPADLSDAAAVEALAARLVDELGPIDVLVNNAGIAAAGNAEVGEPEAWQRMLNVNLLAPMILTRRLSAGMIARERGTIVNVGSVAALEGAKTQGAYAASKFGLRGWSLSCYQRLRPYGIKVTIVHPGFVRTEMTAGVEGARLDRMLLPQDVADAAMLAVTTSPMCCPEEIILRLTKPAWQG